MKTQNVQFFSAVVLLMSFFFAIRAHAQITPTGDAYTNSTTPTTNYGAKTLLDVDAASQISYIQFDLTSIPAGASVSQATLKLYVNSVTTAGGFNVDYVNGSWSEGTIDYSNAPALGASIASGVEITTTEKNHYVLINVTPALVAWLDGSQTNDGIALVANGSFNATFDSKENSTTSHPPELDVVFAGGGGGTITGVLTGAGSGLTGGGTSGTLNLSLLNTCAASQVLQWNGSGWGCASVGAGTITGVTAGTDLTGGGSSGNVTLNLDTTKVPQLAVANTFTGSQTVNGNLSATGLVAGSGYQIGSNLFAFGSYANTNAFLGFAGNTTTTGAGNTGGGVYALNANTTGGENTATGAGALAFNTTGDHNTASGAYALNGNTGGTGNTANGGLALQANTAGSWNTASGLNALGANTTGSSNTASGVDALYNNAGDDNTASGVSALSSNSTGKYNTASGAYSGVTVDFSNIRGSFDTFMGYDSGLSTGTLNNATAIGAWAEVAASNAMVLGSINGVGFCAPTNNCTNTLVGIGITAPTALLHIGNTGGTPASKLFLRIEGPAATGTGASAFSMGGLGDFQIDAPNVAAGRFYVREDGAVAIGTNTPIGGNRLTISQGAGPAIADNWVQYSSRRWKTNIRPLTDALGKVERLRGVSYDLKSSGQHQIGVIAEEVGEVVPEVVSYEENGKDARGVDYSRLTALLIEAVKQQQTQIAVQQSQLRKQQRLANAQLQEIRGQHRQIATEQKQISALKQRATTLESMMTNLQQERKQVELAAAK